MSVLANPSGSALPLHAVQMTDPPSSVTFAAKDLQDSTSSAGGCPLCPADEPVTTTNAKSVGSSRLS